MAARGSLVAVSAEAAPARGQRLAWRPEIAAAVCLAVLASFSSWSRSELTRTLLPNGDDVWFESDQPRIVADMSDRRSDHYRSEVHPLFSLLTTPVVYVLGTTLHISPVQAIRLVVAATAATWAITLFGLLRLLGLHRLIAVWFAVMGITTAAAVCWFAVPETFALGAIGIMLALIVTALSSSRTVSAAVYTAVSAFTLSVTVTNWMAGIVMAAVALPPRQAIRTSVKALGIVTAAWAVQKVFFRSVRFFVRSTHELKYVEPLSAYRLWQVIRAFFVHSVLAPQFVIVDAGPYRSIPLKLVTQFSPIPSDPWALAGVFAWLGLLAIGAVAMVRMREHGRTRLSLAVILGGQLALHLVYGNETFLYSLHWVPLLVVVAALGTRTRARPIALGLAVVATIAMLITNTRRFDLAATAAAGIMTRGGAVPTR